MSIIKDLIGNKHPVAAIVLGSGWEIALKHFKIVKSIPYSRIPSLGRTSVKGHAGILHLASIGSDTVLIFQGRRHYYEGNGWKPVKSLIQICIDAKTQYLILTNAAGGIRKDLKRGTIMIIRDHINLMGSNPLIGPHESLFGTRFPDQSNIYRKHLVSKALSCAKRLGLRPTTGIYAALSGPCYETPAEVEMLRRSGADAVGMSTVPEAILANAAGLNVIAISCITNMAAGISKSDLSHDEVLSTTAKALQSCGLWLKNLCLSLKQRSL